MQRKMEIRKEDTGVITKIIQREVQATVSVELGVTNRKIDDLVIHRTSDNIVINEKIDYITRILAGEQGELKTEGFVARTERRVGEMWEVYKISKWLWGVFGIGTLASAINLIIVLRDLFR